VEFWSVLAGERSENHGKAEISTKKTSAHCEVCEMLAFTIRAGHGTILLVTPPIHYKFFAIPHKKIILL
jgi:hypothetical protein